MIWFWLAGFISGIATVILVIRIWILKHMKRVTAEELINDIERIEKANGTCDRERREVPEPEGNADRKNDLGSTPEQRMENTGQGNGNGCC